MIEKLSADKLALLFGEPAGEILAKCKKSLSGFNPRYRLLTSEQLKDTLLEVIKAIDTQSFSISGKDRLKDWEKGWAENLALFKSKNHDLLALIPKYIQKTNIKRLFLDFILPEDNDFELNFYNIYREFIFKKYLKDLESVFEFGCGTGYNLAVMAQLYPEKKFVGLDWAESSVQLVNSLAKAYKYSISGRQFDYFKPDYALELPEKTGFITLNSLEQIGTNFKEFLDFILKKKPLICVNCEPLVELYDENNLMDYLAKRYHTKRNYLNGYLAALHDLAGKNKIEIIKQQRIQFGSLFHEGYSLVVWRPL